MSFPKLDDAIPSGLTFCNAPNARTFGDALLQHQLPYSECQPPIPEGFSIIHRIESPIKPELLRRCVVANHESVIKSVRKGYSDLRSEKCALDFILRNTKVPVPRAISHYTSEDFEQLELQRIDGQTLEESWGVLSVEVRRKIAKEAVAYLKELHKLQSSVVARVQTHLGAVIDRVPMEAPLDKESFITTWIKRYTDHPRVLTFVKDKIADCDQTIGLTHLDLDPSNIIVKDGSIYALIDWESCSYVSGYWYALQIY